MDLEDVAKKMGLDKEQAVARLLPAGATGFKCLYA